MFGRIKYGWYWIGTVALGFIVLTIANEATTFNLFVILYLTLAVIAIDRIGAYIVKAVKVAYIREMIHIEAIEAKLKVSKYDIDSSMSNWKELLGAEGWKTFEKNIKETAWKDGEF